MHMQERQSPIVVNFLIRAVLGLAMIFFVNQFLEFEHISGQIGLNPVTFLASGALGTPGVLLLYGISFYRGM